MNYTTFKDEVLMYRHPNGEALVSTRAGHKDGRQFVAVTADGFRTDYPHWDTVSSVRWDNPEYFTKGFRNRAASIIFNVRESVA